MQESAAIRVLERIEMFLYRRADRIVSVTESFKRNLAQRGIDERKVAVFTNGVDIARFSPRPKDAALVRELGLEGKFVAGYVGTHGMAHALETLLEAASILRDGDDPDGFRILLLGDGARKQALVEQARSMGLDNVVFVDSVPKEEVARYWSLLDASIIHLKKTPLFTTVIPSKLFECMGMGLPVLHGVAGESAEIVRREQVGLVVEPENPEALAAGIQAFDNDKEFTVRCRKSAVEAAKRYDRGALAASMLKILEKVTAD